MNATSDVDRVVPHEELQIYSYLAEAHFHYDQYKRLHPEDNRDFRWFIAEVLRMFKF